MSETVPQEQNLNLHDANNEEFDHRVKKQIRQIEGEYMIEKAVLEQKIDILEAKLREFEERETALKKMNSEIMLTLTDLNRKEDSSLMNKVYEELALANKEKLRERKQHQARFQALKTQAEMNISELKGKLEVKDKERDEMKAMWEEERERYESELEQERKMNEGLKKELEEKRYEAKGGEEFERMKKRVGVLEEENGRLKEEFESEIGRLKEEFERSLSDLKEIHNEERNSYEGRLKKAKEMLARSEGENESKNGIESQLVEEIEMLRKMIGEMEAKSAVEMKRVVSERDAALGRIKELEQGYDCDKEQKTHYSNTEMFVQNLEERLKTLEEREQKDAGLYRTPNVKNTSKNTLFEQPSTEHLIPAFTNFESQIPSLANSIIHEPYYIDQKRPSVIIAPQSQVLVSDPNQFWSNDEQIKIVFSKPNTRSNSRHDLSCMGQTQGSTCCHSEIENKRSMVRSVCAYSEKPENLRDPQLAGNREMNEWALKDTSQRRGNWADQGNIRRQSRVNREDYGISYVNENPVNQDFSLHTVKEEWGYDSRVQSRRGSGTRLQVNYPERLCVRNEGMLLRRNGSQGLLESTLRPEVITEKLEAWNEGRGSVMKEEENQYESNKMFRKGIQDVMTGLHNIKSRLEKQQENIILAKNENIKAISNRRSFSNARIRPSVAPRETVNTSFHNESMIGHYAPGKVYPTTANVSMHMTDENTVNVSNVSHYGEREVQNRFAVGNYHLNYRTRTPVMMRESTRTHFHERHRNSFV